MKHRKELKRHEPNTRLNSAAGIVWYAVVTLLLLLFLFRYNTFIPHLLRFHESNFTLSALIVLIIFKFVALRQKNVSRFMVFVAVAVAIANVFMEGLVQYKAINVKDNLDLIWGLLGVLFSLFVIFVITRSTKMPRDVRSAH